MIERIFMAAESGTQLGRLVGPFSSAAEAEIRAAELGWDWVAVYNNIVDESGKVLDVQKRFYQSAKHQVRFRSLEEIAALRRELETPEPPPLNHEEILFFAAYEIQMLPEPAPRIDTVKFKSDLRKRING